MDRSDSGTLYVGDKGLTNYGDTAWFHLPDTSTNTNATNTTDNHLFFRATAAP